MPLTAEDRRQLARACELAIEWHAKQHRKHSEIPYLSHLLQVAGLVLEHGGDTEQAIAGLFHDCLEDADSPQIRAEREALIADEFGDCVLAIVRVCTDTLPDETLDAKRPWKERKDRYLDQLRAADEKSLLVVACDKRHNLNALVWDISHHGRKYLEGFKGAPEEQLWYFEEVLRIVRNAVPPRLVLELQHLVGQFKKQLA